MDSSSASSYLEYEEFLSSAVRLLQGSDIGDNIKSIAQTLGIKLDMLISLLHSAGTILWEFAKGSPSDATVVSISLQQVGLNPELSEQFANVFS